MIMDNLFFIYSNTSFPAVLPLILNRYMQVLVFKSPTCIPVLYICIHGSGVL